MAEQVVYNSTQLATAVADMNIDVIYFGDNIELTSGISIPANKPSLVFDGTYEEVTYRLTDMNSNGILDTLGIGGASSIELTFQNMDITGRNYYGVPYIYEIGTNNVTVTYRNITYSGPQLVFNSLGLTHFENVDITIIPSSVSRASEVGEVCRVDFSGNNIIRHESTADAVFWFRGQSGAAYFRLLPNATLTVNSMNYFMFNYYFFILYPVAYEIQQGASFILNSNHGISLNPSHTASSFLVDTGASFRYIQGATDESYSSLYLTETFTVNQSGSVYMQANYANAQPLLNFPSGTGNSLILNNPKSFVLYDRTNAPVASGGTRNYSINTEQLNRWTTLQQELPEAGGFDDIPQFYWHNVDWATFTVSGNITSTTTSATAPQLINPQTPISNFTYQNSRVISAGSILIEPDTVIDNGRPITGLTEPNANLRISFTVGGSAYLFELTAGEDGRFEVDTGMPIPVETAISISVNTPFLIKAIETTVVTAGEITIISAPERIVFRTPPVSTNPVLLRRPATTVPVVVSDNRPNLTRWELMVSIVGPLQAANGEVLENAVVFRDDNDVLWELSDTPIVIYTGEPSADPTSVNWEESKGILVRVTRPIHSGLEYSTQLIWTLNAIDES